MTRPSHRLFKYRYPRYYPFIILLVLFITAIATSRYFQGQEAIEFTSWIGRHAIELNHDTPYINGTAGLAILKNTLGKRLIAIGESTHGTHEFDIIKLELLGLLVAKSNSRVLALEESFSRCLLLDKKLNESTPIDSLMTLIGARNLQTVEFRNTLQWIKKHNIEYPDERISIVGIDCKGIEYTIKPIELFYGKYDSSLTQKMIDCIKRIGKAPKFSSGSPLFSLSREFKEVTRELEKKVILPASNVTPKHFCEVKALQNMIQQYTITYSLSTIEKVSQKRDSCMAVNLMQVLDTLQPTKSIVLSAHNGHISKDNWTSDFRPLGNRLKEMLGRDYFAIALDFAEGYFRANDPSIPNSPDWETIRADKPTSRHLGCYFRRADKSFAYLSLNSSEYVSPIALINSQPLRMNSVGATSLRGFFTDDSCEIVLGKSFDAVIMIRTSSPTTIITSNSRH